MKESYWKAVTERFDKIREKNREYRKRENGSDKVLRLDPHHRQKSQPESAEALSSSHRVDWTSK
jgi:hypothetical protein